MACVSPGTKTGACALPELSRPAGSVAFGSVMPTGSDDTPGALPHPRELAVDGASTGGLGGAVAAVKAGTATDDGVAEFIAPDEACLACPALEHTDAVEGVPKAFAFRS